jgi:hypothetical protein
MKKINLGSHRWNPNSGRKLEYIKWDHVPNDILYQREELKRSFYDRDYEKVILVFFKSGAGGLFLANCLSLSDSVCSSFLNIDEKMRLIKKYLNTETTFWYDCYVNNYYPEAYMPKSKEKKWHTVDGYFMVHEHEPQNIKHHLDFWTNCSVIYFKNPDLFCKIRKVYKNIDGNFGYVSYEPVLKTISNVPIPNSFEEYFKLSEKEQDKLKETYKSNENIYSCSFLNNKKLLYVWDTNWYFSEKDVLIHVKELYDLLGFTDFNKRAIKDYYKLWIAKLDQLSKREIPDNLDELLKDESNYDKNISTFDDLEELT